MNFWQQLPRPFFALAPMEDVTDAAFRRLIARHSKPHVMYTEFTSADGLVLAPATGQKALRKKLIFAPEERPIVVQLFSAYPERMEEAARIVTELGFDGIDINMGCPDRAIEKGRCGAAMMKDPAHAKEMIRAAKRGTESASKEGRAAIPISVKTRIGYARNDLQTWLPALLEEDIAEVTIHARTRSELSDVPARWEHVAEAIQIRDRLGVDTLIMGNGDVRSLADARQKAHETGCDGVMLGRAIYGNPWLFEGANNPERSRGTEYCDEHEARTPQERIAALIEHLTLFDQLLADTTNYSVMKKHFKAYISGWDHAKALREQLMATEHIADALHILRTHHA